MDGFLKVKLLTKGAILPTRGSKLAIGLDLYADLKGAEYKLHIPSHTRLQVHTGVSVAIPAGHYGRIAPRSGLAWKHGINVMAGVIDADYRGELIVILYNTNALTFVVDHGDRVAQLILERADLLPVVQVNDLDQTARGIGGFGSTDIKTDDKLLDALKGSLHVDLRNANHK